MDTVVLYPCPIIGHLVSMVELGKLILKNQPSFSIIIFITSNPYNTGSTDRYISRVSATTPSITFHHLPTVSPPPNSSTVDIAFDIPRLNNPHVHQALQAISQKSKLRAFVIDFFCDASFQVSTSLHIPTYYFHTSGASGLCLFLYLTTIHETFTQNILKLNNTSINVPGVPTMHPSDFPDTVSNRNTTVYNSFLNSSINMSKSSGIITNTFELLEPMAVKAISDGLCVPKGSTPPIHCLGPLVASSNDQRSGSEECLNWLDTQPNRSVVFLCFGSMGTFKAEQLKEMAIGLEKSGHRFLWVVRNPPTEDEDQIMLEQPQDPDLDSLLPEGFLARTKQKGLVVKSWAPQIAVLNHESVGGFVTHAGWNSTLEAICAGVPMVAWPLYAEQRMNRLFLVEEINVALNLETLKGGFVTATELEKRVRELMESESGKKVRERVMDMRDGAKAAMREGGSSYMALAKLLESWKQ